VKISPTLVTSYSDSEDLYSKRYGEETNEWHPFTLLRLNILLYILRVPAPVILKETITIRETSCASALCKLTFVLRISARS